MSYATFFEIGGHVVESYVEDLDGIPTRPKPLTLEKELKRVAGVPIPLGRAAKREMKGKTGVDIGKFVEGTSHAKRANWAVRAALAIAIVDGPLPFGDMLAIGGLAAYGGYETYMAAKAFSEV